MSQDVPEEGSTHQFQIELDSSRISEPKPAFSIGQQLKIQIELKHVKEDDKGRILDELPNSEVQKGRKSSNTKKELESFGMLKTKSGRPHKTNEIQEQETINNYELGHGKSNSRFQKVSGQEHNLSKQDFRGQSQEHDLIMGNWRQDLVQEETKNVKERPEIETKLWARSGRVQDEKPKAKTKEELDEIAFFLDDEPNPEKNHDVLEYAGLNGQFQREFRGEEGVLPHFKNEQHQKRRHRDNSQPIEDRVKYLEAKHDPLKKKRDDLLKMTRFALDKNDHDVPDTSPKQSANAGPSKIRSGSDLDPDLHYHLVKISKLDTNCGDTDGQSDPMTPYSKGSLDQWTDSMLDAHQDHQKVEKTHNGNQTDHQNQSESEDTSSDLSEDQFPTPTCCFWKCL
eukprot:TCALIF_13076-PA protein Name:"Protein of unknown function" AED:0.03 eAED:0.03 QI:125/0.5/0.33/1/1/1/3/0/396